MNGNVFWNTVGDYFFWGSGTRQGGGYVSIAPRRWISVSWVWTCVPLRRADGQEWSINATHKMGKADARSHRGLRTQADGVCGGRHPAGETSTPFPQPHSLLHSITDFLPVERVSQMPLPKDGRGKAGLKLNIQKTKIMASGPITSWQTDGETVETVADFIFWGSKITADGDYSHEIKRHLLLGRKVMTN